MEVRNRVISWKASPSMPPASRYGRRVPRVHPSEVAVTLRGNSIPFFYYDLRLPAIDYAGSFLMPFYRGSFSFIFFSRFGCRFGGTGS